MLIRWARLRRMVVREFTVEEAVQAFLQDEEARQLAKTTTCQSKTLFEQQLLAWAKSQSLVFLDQLTTAKLREFRASWKNCALTTQRKHHRLNGFCEAYKFFEEAIAHLQRILEINPLAVAYDLHPDYLSTKWPLARNDLPLFGVQHHHAHIVSCMAENRIHGPVIGIALDGTGYGTDGTIWGGEVLICDAVNLQRTAHLSYLPMPGGPAAIREPWRMALSYLWREFGVEALHLGLPFLREIDQRSAQFVLRMLENGVNTPLTSSCGRLFDAVAAIANVRSIVTYEAQAAIELETCLDRDASVQPYAMQLTDHGDHLEIGCSQLMHQLVRDALDAVPPAIISRKFYDGLGDILVRAAIAIRERCHLDRICLSGGTFQNAWLAARIENLLPSQEFQVFTHSEVPCGDG